MSYREFTPDASLHTRVDCIWTSVIDSPSPVHHDVLPDGAVDLIAILDDDDSLRHVFVAGAMTRPSPVTVHAARFFGIRLFPGAAHTMLGIPQHELTDRNTSVDDIMSVRTATTVKAMMHRAALHAHHCQRVIALRARNSTTAVATPTLDHQALHGIFETLGAERRDIPPVVREAAHTIAQHSGTTRVAEIARNTHVTRQHLGRLFSEHVGLSPKTFAEVCRVRAMLSQASVKAYAWTDLAYEFGYVDQSHLIASVRRVTGRTPSEWRANPGSISPIATGRGN